MATMKSLIPLLSVSAALAAPAPPSSDPFYTPPSSLNSSTPGTVLHSRSADAISAQLAAHGISIRSATQLLYRSTDSLNQPVGAVTTLIVPANGNTSRLLSYHAPYDSDDNACAPSYNLAINPQSSDAEIIAQALSRGWAVAVPDYESVRGMYTVGPTSGKAVLDGLRAVLSSSLVPRGADVQALGYSGGCIATTWAAEYLHAYAPELEAQFLGSAAGGFPANLTAALGSLDGTSQASLIPRAMIGLGRQVGAFAALLERHFLPGKRTEFESASKCGFRDVFANRNVLESYFDVGDELVSDQVWRDTIGQVGIMGTHGRPTRPFYAFQGAKDEVVPVAAVDALVEKYCAEGSVVEYVRNPGTNHGGEYGKGLPGAVAFLEDRFAGREWIGKCETRDVDA